MLLIKSPRPLEKGLTNQNPKPLSFHHYTPLNSFNIKDLDSLVLFKNRSKPHSTQILSQSIIKLTNFLFRPSNHTTPPLKNHHQTLIKPKKEVAYFLILAFSTLLITSLKPHFLTHTITKPILVINFQKLQKRFAHSPFNISPTSSI